MLERAAQRFSIKEIFSVDTAGRIFGLIIAFSAVMLITILGYKTGSKIVISILFILLAHLLFRGALFLTIVAFIGLLSMIDIFSIKIFGDSFIEIGPGEIFIIVLNTFFLILYIKNFNRIKFTSDPFKLPLLLILVTSIISLVHAENITNSLQWFGVMVSGYLFYRWIIHFRGTNTEKIFYAAVFIYTLLILMSISKYLVSPEQFEVTTKLSSVFRGRYGILAGPNSVAAILATLFPLLFIYIKTKKVPNKFFFIIIFLLGFYVLYLTGSRGGYLAAVFAILLTVYLITEKKRRFSFVLLTFGALLLLLILNPSTLKRIITIFYYQVDLSAVTRFVLWFQAIEAFKSYPLTGIGVANFIYLPMSLSLHNAHSQFLNMLAETGIVGGFSYILLLSLVFKRLIKVYRLETNFKKMYAAALLGSWSAFTIHNLIDVIWGARRHPKETMFFWLMLALVTITIRRADVNEHQ